MINEVIREKTEQETQVYNALGKWAERLNKWEYQNQLKRNKGKKLKTFSPNEFSLELIDGGFIEAINNYELRLHN